MIGGLDVQMVKSVAGGQRGNILVWTTNAPFVRFGDRPAKEVTSRNSDVKDEARRRIDRLYMT